MMPTNLYEVHRQEYDDRLREIYFRWKQEYPDPDEFAGFKKACWDAHKEINDYD